MNIKNKRPVFVPSEFQSEFEQLSKAALMDMVWDYAQQNSDSHNETTIAEFRLRREIILAYRKQATTNVD